MYIHWIKKWIENLLWINVLFFTFLRSTKNGYSLEKRPFFEISGKPAALTTFHNRSVLWG